MINSPTMWIASLVVGCFSAYFARKRGQNPYVWFLIGFLLGVFGVMTFFFASRRGKKKEAAPTERPLFIDGPTDKFWYYLGIENKQEGPMSRDALDLAWKNGKVSDTTYVWHEDLSDWKPLRELLKN
jgi:hypothetical protein